MSSWPAEPCSPAKKARRSATNKQRGSRREAKEGHGREAAEMSFFPGVRPPLSGRHETGWQMHCHRSLTDDPARKALGHEVRLRDK